MERKTGAPLGYGYVRNLLLYKEGCKFRVSKTIAGKKITDNMVTMLCNSGRTALIHNFKSKAGSEFDAYLVLDKAKGSIGFAFPDSKK